MKPLTTEVVRTMIPAAASRAADTKWFRPCAR